MSRRSRSAITPFACSMTMRLFSAWLSCSLRVCASSAARCWRMAMVATSARACADVDVGRSHRPWLAVEQVEGTDHSAAQAHRQGVDRVVAGGDGFGHEPGPAAVDRGQVLVHDWLTRSIAVEARALLRLQLEQFQHPHRLAGRRHHPQLPVGCDQHQSSCVDVEHVDAAISEKRQQLHHVEVGDQRVGQLHERSRERRFSRHATSSPFSH